MEVHPMATARVFEISVTSETSFEDAIEQGINSVDEEHRNFVASAWVKEQRVNVEAGAIVGYQVNLMVTVVAPEGKPAIW
jgi:flavin-binding protein dodecin